MLRCKTFQMTSNLRQPDLENRDSTLARLLNPKKTTLDPRLLTVSHSLQMTDSNRQRLRQQPHHLLETLFKPQVKL